MKVAIVHEWFVDYSGSEKVVEQLLQIFPQADLFAVIDFMPHYLRKHILHKPVTTTFIQKLPFAQKHYQYYFFLMPLAIEQLDVSGYDVVISSSHAVSKGVLTHANQLHICYCHSPARYAWDLYHQTLRENDLTNGFKGLLAKLILHNFRKWDYATAQRVDFYISNSRNVSRRIKKNYNQDSTVIYPPVDIEKFTISYSTREEFFLTISRLVPYKRLALIVTAFNEIPEKQLIVIGEGPEYDNLKTIAKSNITILGYQPIEVLTSYLQRAKAFVFAAEEDFGISPVEAMACGTPVIAFGKGGTLETVSTSTGLFFYQQDKEAIINAVHQFENTHQQFSPQVIRSSIEKFNSKRFREEVYRFVMENMRSTGNSSSQQFSFWKDAYVYLIYLYAFVLPLRSNLKNVLLFVLIGAFLLQMRNKKVTLAILKNSSFKAITAYVSVCVLSLLYSTDLEGTGRFILLQGYLFLFPILVHRQLSVKQVQNTLLLFSFGCFLLTIYATVFTAFQYVDKIPEHAHSLATLDWTFFSYFIPQNISFHAPYYSLYISVCLLTHSYFLYTSRLYGKNSTYLIHLIYWLFFFCILTLLSSRTALISTIVVLAFIAFYLTFNARKYLLLMAVVLVTSFTSVLILPEVPYLRTKFNENAGVAQRKMMWISALQLIKESPVLGVGPGDTEGALVDIYNKNSFEEGVTFRFDAHNQYLMVGVSLGMIGLLTFLFFLYSFLKDAYLQKNFILFSFLAVFVLCCLTESLLQRKDGALLFSFISSLLLFGTKELKKTDLPEHISEKR